MAHECPECGCRCHCGGDIDDIVLPSTRYENNCRCCPDPLGEDDGDYFDEDDILGFDCHMDHRGACGKAGSEECEFECPYNHR